MGDLNRHETRVSACTNKRMMMMMILGIHARQLFSFPLRSKGSNA